MVLNSKQHLLYILQKIIIEKYIFQKRAKTGAKCGVNDMNRGGPHPLQLPYPTLPKRTRTRTHTQQDPLNLLSSHSPFLN